MMLTTVTPMPDVSDLLGHTSITTTVDIYGHPTGDAGHRAAALLDALVAEARARPAADVVPIRRSA